MTVPPQGFWDMVYYQVDGLYKTFQKLKDMESNDWTPLPLSPKKPKTQVCSVRELALPRGLICTKRVHLGLCEVAFIEGWPL